jgi:hypothetical protein
MSRSWFRSSARLALLATALTLLPTAAFAGSDSSSLHVHIDGDDGGRVDVDLSLGWLATFVDWADIECDSHTDSDTRRMARSLDRQGEGSVYEFEDDDGDNVVARRVKGALKIESRDEDGEISRVEMPWPLAECLFLGREPKGGLRSALRDGDFRIRVEGHDGDRVAVDVD